MAIDTQQKRQSAASVGKVWKGKAPVPGGSIDAPQRLHVAWKYAGIAAEAPTGGGSKFRWDRVTTLVSGDNRISSGAGFLSNAVPGSAVSITWNTHNLNDNAITATVPAGGVKVYKNSSTTESTTGVSTTVDFDGITGLHLVTIDTSQDTDFYELGSMYHVVLVGATIDGKTVNNVLSSFQLGELVS